MLLRSFSSRIFRHDNPQCALTNPVLKRSFHRFDLAVKGNSQTFVTCLNLQLVGKKRHKIFVVTQASKHSTNRKTYQFQTSCSVCDVNAQHTSIKPIPQTDIEQVHCILVIADKHKRRRAIQHFTVNTESNVEKWIPAESLNRGPKERRPFSMPESLTLFSFSDDDRIETQTRVVNKNAIIHFSHVNVGGMAGNDCACRCFGVERNF